MSGWKFGGCGPSCKERIGAGLCGRTRSRPPTHALRVGRARTGPPHPGRLPVAPRCGATAGLRAPSGGVRHSIRGNSLLDLSARDPRPTLGGERLQRVQHCARDIHRWSDVLAGAAQSVHTLPDEDDAPGSGQRLPREQLAQRRRTPSRVELTDARVQLVRGERLVTVQRGHRPLRAGRGGTAGASWPTPPPVPSRGLGRPSPMDGSSGRAELFTCCRSRSTSGISSSLRDGSWWVSR
jgi:hypothetical protein